jgi:nucleoside 2-deoxyribosyltransferase
MQYADGRGWRNEISIPLKEMGVIVLDPYKKPFIKDVDEGDTAREAIQKSIDTGNYEETNRLMKKIRSYDLAMVDRSDFLIAYINPKIPTIGSIEEITTAVKMKRPVYIFVEGSKKACPWWIFGMIPHTYIYDSMQEVVDELKKIDSGEVEAEDDRWRLFRMEYK